MKMRAKRRRLAWSNLMYAFDLEADPHQQDGLFSVPYSLYRTKGKP